jgi:predicted transcriptional regulator
MISKMELARRAGISNLTVNRIENGADCRMETKRKILTALSLSAHQKERVFPEH